MSADVGAHYIADLVVEDSSPVQSHGECGYLESSGFSRDRHSTERMFHQKIQQLGFRFSFRGKSMNCDTTDSSRDGQRGQTFGKVRLLSVSPLVDGVLNLTVGTFTCVTIG